jgi:hypothetical protein
MTMHRGGEDTHWQRDVIPMFLLDSSACFHIFAVENSICVYMYGVLTVVVVSFLQYRC